ncbi:DUF6185 family protein [Streptomyces longisporoflavus]|uniref:DUF6185 family protein n=1 Tax=Streptomyces longisporoflavus TaxID=28044 RepID=UPI00167E9FC2|nr:DUF6185 family protein [Streptomyces longisporoflavus]
MWVAPSAAAASDSTCDTDTLVSARVEAEARIDHDARTYAKVSTTVKLTLPMSWDLAGGLLLGKESDGYRKAMRCLVRGDFDGVETRWEEWRSAEPEVIPTHDPSGQGSSRGKWLQVRVVAHTWLDQQADLSVGPWTIETGKARWLIRLRPPSTLEGALWRKVTVDAGRQGAVSAVPKPSAGEGGSVLVWRPAAAEGVPTITVRVEPAWPRDLAARDDSPPHAALDEAGGVLWNVTLVVFVWYALIALPRHGVPDALEQRTVANLRHWVRVLLGVTLVVRGHDVYLGSVGTFEATDEWPERAVHAPWAWLVSAMSGALLLLFARPPRAVVLVGSGLGAGAAVPALGAIVLPRTLGIDPTRFIVPPDPGAGAVAAVGVATVCSFLLPLLGGALSVRRLLVEGGLWRPRHPRPRPAPGMCGVLAVVTVIGACYAAASERDWTRASWLSPRLDPGHWAEEADTGARAWEWGYGSWHSASLRGDLLWFTHTGHWWWVAMLWIPSGLAILAVLRSRVAGSADTPLARRGPQGVDRLLLLLLFPVMATMEPGVYAASSALAWCWFLLYFLALTALLRLTRSRAVAVRPLGSGESLATSLCASHRAGLLHRARRYRELHAQLRSLEQDPSEEAIGARRALESSLRRLHRWHTAPGRRDRLPRDVSVVDAALALGPCPTWWGNGSRAARLTQPIALPFSMTLVWTNQLRGESLTSTLHDRFGLVEVLTQLVLWQIGYAAAGFLLGALWQDLPGRRGPSKAIPLAVAYAAPIGLFALGNWALDEEQTSLAFAAAAILLILTLTGVMMDLETFGGERPYWRSRLSLLRSIYQIRYISIQMAWILAQAAAIATILQYLADNGGMPPPFTGIAR